MKFQGGITMNCHCFGSPSYWSIGDSCYRLTLSNHNSTTTCNSEPKNANKGLTNKKREYRYQPRHPVLEIEPSCNQGEMKPAEFGDLMMCNTHLATVDAMLKGLPSSGLDLQNILKMINFEWKIMETIYIYM